MAMEADWGVEIGPSAPIIDAHWAGFVDLQRSPELVLELEEVNTLPGLDAALVRMNTTNSPVWTAKCDVWPVVDLAEVDEDEMNATADSARHAWGCYIDLLPKSDQTWATPAMAVDWCKSICDQLHSVPLPCCRADLIVRRAVAAEEHTDIGITAYLTSCGTASEAANHVLGTALSRFVDTLRGGSTIE